MFSVTSELKEIRQQVTRAQVETAGRHSISSMVVWSQQKEDSVNQIPEGFSGLVIHLTPEVTDEESLGLSQNEFEALKQRLRDSLNNEVS